MQLRYDDDFLEGAVFFCANSRRNAPPTLQVRRFHSEREKLYDILDPDERNEAFFRLHLEWFREWSLEKLLLEIAAEFPLLRTDLNALVFRKARTKTDEGAELYVKESESCVNSGAGVPLLRHAVVALRVERFEQRAELAGFLRHEFTHLHDMLNPEFGYSPQLHLPGQNAAQQRATRERYRLLWDITIDGRLAERGFDSLKQKHRVAFDQTFNFWSKEKRAGTFESFWSNSAPRHEHLVAIASDPRKVKSSSEPQPGGPCPLCAFPTFAWANVEAIARETLVLISSEFPEWSSEQGLCGRCAEIYKSSARQRPVGSV